MTNFKMTAGDELPESWVSLMSSCWQENPTSRPTFRHIHALLRDMNHGRETNLVDSIIKRLEFHTNKLEVTVEKRLVM